ncbi:TPA: tetratricopeptide repeat protein, partial [Candidatus Micrarchaeota archaeon]|nr:tetratricopeptide repeat protein [Candidatus Micrarchaeota archaeon]
MGMHLQLSPRESGSQGSAKSTTISKIKPTDSQRIRRQAKEHLDSKRPEQAIKLLESLLLENPTDKHAISLLIKAYDHEDRLEDAKTIFDIAERHRLLDGQIRYHMLKAHARAGEVDQAKEVFQAAVRKFEDSRQYYGIMLELFIENGRWKDAMECLKLANERGHAQPMHYSMMIGAARKTRDSAAVGKLVREAVSRDLTNGAVYSEVFNHYLELRDVRNAFRIFRRMKPLR